LIFTNTVYQYLGHRLALELIYELKQIVRKETGKR
jgi:hypothetical protein